MATSTVSSEVRSRTGSGENFCSGGAGVAMAVARLQQSATVYGFTLFVKAVYWQWANCYGGVAGVGAGSTSSIVWRFEGKQLTQPPHKFLPGGVTCGLVGCRCS